MKIWLALEEKKIPYRVEKINMSCYGDKPPEFRRLQPNGQIPVAIIDGRVYGQSNDILVALEELFPDSKSLRPPAGQEGRANALLALERQLFSAWMYWLKGNARNNRESFRLSLQQVEQALSEMGPFFCGAKVSTVDFMYASFLERMAASLLYFKGFQMRVTPGAPTDYPAVNRWFDAMEELESYRLTKSDMYVVLVSRLIRLVGWWTD
jgi:glutathione S-transferase